MKNSVRHIWIIILVIQFLILNLEAQTYESSHFSYFTSEQILMMKNAVKNNDTRVKQLVKYIRSKADSYLKKGPWSVTFIKGKAASGDPQDFYSEGSYWWPDPNNPDRPYIRKDGVRNPNRFVAHDSMLAEVYNSVYYLGMAAYFLNEKKYADHASKIIYTWFLDPATKMNPNMDYSQAIKGVTTGRGTGIIDAHRYSMFTDAIQLLHDSGNWNDQDYESIKEWFRQFYDWLTKSKNGLKEKNSGNNHATWWTAQTISYTIFLNDKNGFNELIEHTKKDLISNQIEQDGSCPREEARTRSLHYSVFNLEAFALICHMAFIRGIDLWNYSGKNSGSVMSSVKYLMPYMKDPSLWKKQQLDKFKDRQPLFLALTYIDNGGAEYEHQYFEMGKTPKARNNEPFKVLINMLLALKN